MNIFEHENLFYRHCDTSRISKFLAHSKLYEMTLNLPGHFIEVGVFRGASFSRFRKLGKLFHPDHNRNFYGFDIFGEFPDADFEEDKKELLKQWESDGKMGIDVDEFYRILQEQELHRNVQLIKGDVVKTLPQFFQDNQAVSIAIANIDLDLYGPIKKSLEEIFPRVVRGGIVILDDYEGFPGAKKAVDEYLAEHQRPERIQKLPYCFSPVYLIKE